MSHDSLRSRSRVVLQAGVACLWIAGCSSSDAGTSTTDVTKGMAAVTQYGCQGCHGVDLSGTQTAYPNTTAYPANLTPDGDTGLGSWSTAVIANAILNGVDDEGAQLCPIMPQFKTMNMTEAVADQIAAYLKTLPPKKNDVPESTCAAVNSGGAAGSQ
jgi:mono/diheme cytochrome c family protein